MVSHRTENIKTAPSRAQRLAQYNDIFFQTVRPYQRNNYLFKKKDGIYVFSTGYAQIRTSMDSGFLFTILQSDSFVNQVILNSTGSSYPAINPTNLAKLSIDIIENKSEQRAIATYFRHLDSLIETVDKKLASLKQVKEASLQSMFPKKGQKVPEVRFKGFEGEWKECTFNNLVDRISSYSSSKSLPTVEFEDIISGENRLNKDVYSKPIHKGGIAFEKNDVLFGKLRPYLKNILFATFNGIAVGDFWVLRANESYPAFVYTLVNNKSFMDVANISSGSKMPRADWNLVSNHKFLVPSFSEQRKIASFFVHLDKQIAIAQQRLDLLRRIKSACLDEMFV